MIWTLLSCQPICRQINEIALDTAYQLGIYHEILSGALKQDHANLTMFATLSVLFTVLQPKTLISLTADDGLHPMCLKCLVAVSKTLPHKFVWHHVHESVSAPFAELNGELQQCIMIANARVPKTLVSFNRLLTKYRQLKYGELFANFEIRRNLLAL